MRALHGRPVRNCIGPTAYVYSFGGIKSGWTICIIVSLCFSSNEETSCVCGYIYPVDMFSSLCRGKIWDDVMPGNLLNINSILAIKKKFYREKVVEFS